MGFFIHSIGRRSLGYKLLSTYCVLCMILFIGEFYLAISPEVDDKMMGMALSWIGYSILSFVSVWFALYLVNREDLINTRYWALLFIVPVIGIIGSFVNCVHPIFYTIYVLPTGFIHVGWLSGIFMVIFNYSFLVSVAAILILVWGLMHNKTSRRPLFIVLAAIFIPTLGSLFVFNACEIIPLTFSFDLILLWWAVFGHDVLDLSLVHREFIDYANVGMLFFNEHGRLMEFNNFFKNLQVYNKIDFNQSVDEVFKNRQNVLDFYYSDESEITYFSDINDSWFKVNKNKVYDDNVLMGSILTYEDITREVEKQEYLELLIRESNHRVRNNLNLLNRFISLEKRFHEDEPEKIIENTVSRIDSLSLFHEKLYKTDNLKDIAVKDYLASFIDDISDLYGGGRVVISYGSNDDDLTFTGEKIIPVSLILTELIINSIKYAYNGFDIGNKLSINIGRFGDKIVLHYSDDGNGLPDGFDPDKSTGLGWIVIKSLVSQLDGEYEVFNDDGMHFKLTFNI